MATRKAARKKTRASGSGTLRAKEGRAGKATIVSYDESLMALAAAAEAAPMPQIPRPATTRFPVDQETFLALKGAAKKTKATMKSGAEVVSDRRSGRTAAPAEMLLAAAPPETAPAALSLLANFPGLPSTGWLPYDATLATGPEHVMVSVNASVGFYAKSGSLILQRSLASWFSSVVTNAKIFDPKVLYDQFARRWVLLAVGLAANPNRSWFLLSISETADPRGRWFNYALDATRDGSTATNNWADYPAIGVDADALYITANMFRFGGAFQYAKLRVIPKAGPYAGGTMRFSDFVKLKNDDGSMAFTIQPCHTFGSPGVEYLVNTLYPSSTRPTQNQLTVWSLRDAATAPRLSRKSVTIAPYSLPPDADQKGGGTPLDTGDIRMLNAVYSGGSVWCVFTTAQTWSGTNRAAFCWLQLRPSENAILQQGIFGARDGSYFYPAIMSDVHGNVIVTFARCSSTEFASVHYSGRTTTDPSGRLRPSVLLKAGVANYLGLDGMGRNRWGDYAGIALDPVDSRQIWLYHGYAAGANLWATQIGAARF